MRAVSSAWSEQNHLLSVGLLNNPLKSLHCPAVYHAKPLLESSASPGRKRLVGFAASTLSYRGQWSKSCSILTKSCIVRKYDFAR